MQRIPAHQDFDDGNHLLLTSASALVPRLLWPDKPEAGGKESMKYFTGLNITVGQPMSVRSEKRMEVSVRLVAFFICSFSGLFIRWVYKRVFVIAQRLPLLILWIPVLFYQVTYCMETDSLQIFNSLLKGAFFLWLLYKLVPGWFGKAVKQCQCSEISRSASIACIIIGTSLFIKPFPLPLVQLIFRKTNPLFFSIEKVFASILAGLQKKVTVEPAYMPFYNSSISDMIRNMVFAGKGRADIFHVTGDVHYVVLALACKKNNPHDS